MKCESSGAGVARALVAAVLLLAGLLPARAQWLTQTNVIAPGWSAVYFYVDGSSQTLDQLVGSDPANPIDQIWLWKTPASTAQYLINPVSPLNAGGPWLTWVRNATNSINSLVALAANSACLVHSTAPTTNYIWKIQGQPVPPSYSWDMTGLNFIGFPTPYANPPSFQSYLAPDPAVSSIAQIWEYTYGPLDPIYNPELVFARAATKVVRGQAFWVSATNVYNAYFGPFQVNLPNPSGINFGASGSQTTFHLNNYTTNTLQVSLRLLASETPPASQAGIVAPPPLLVEGALNSSNLTYAATALAVTSSATATNSCSWTLAPAGQPGSDVSVVLGINRFALNAGPAGSLYAGTLQFTDSLGFSEVDVPVSASSASTVGLWVGSATVSQVGSYLKTYATNADGSLAAGTNGSYVVASVNTSLGAVPTAYPLRLILFNDGTNSSLLQRVYYGLRQNTNIVVATTESVLDPSHLATARRISTTVLPWNAVNLPWTTATPLAPGATVSFTVTEAYDDQPSNPFLHTYHPDHNNLNFNTTPPTELPAGSESYAITQVITLVVGAGGTDFASLTKAGTTLSGSYSEAVTFGGLGGAARTFNSAGAFTLTQISPIGTLTTQ